jgi:hypothetical protein
VKEVNMKLGTGAAKTWWLSLGMIPLLAASAMAGPSSGTALVGNATLGTADSDAAGKKRDDDTVARNSWTSTVSKGQRQQNINQRVAFKRWDDQAIGDAKKQLDDRRKVDPVLDAKLRALEKYGQRNPKDMHPAEYLEWLKLQDDKDVAFIRPPPNKILIVDQEKLAGLDKNKIGVKYQKTTVCPRIVTYKPVYKTITVYYPG